MKRLLGRKGRRPLPRDGSRLQVRRLRNVLSIGGSADGEVLKVTEIHVLAHLGLDPAARSVHKASDLELPLGAGCH